MISREIIDQRLFEAFPELLTKPEDAQEEVLDCLVKNIHVEDRPFSPIICF